MDYTVGLSVGAFAVILALLMLLRSTNSKFEVKPTDIVVALLPILIFLLITGKIQKFEVGELKIETAFVKASTSAIAPQVAPLTGLPSEPIRTDPKMGVGDIPKLIERKTQGLLFRLGYGGYYGPAIRDYLVGLVKQPFLRYIIIENSDRTFFALADARSLADVFANPGAPYTPEQFAQWLDSSDKTALARLPGFISSEHAVALTTDKRRALQRMESLNADTLPVVDDKGRFVGIVNRSRLTASLILDVAQDLKQ